jgi:hypothetical protein
LAGDYYFGKIRDRFSETGVGTTAGVTVTKTAATGFRFDVTGIQCSGDAAAIVTIESPASTVIWRKRFAGAFNNGDASFPPGSLKGAADQAVLVKVSASTANCEANIQGFKVKA